MMNQIRKCVLKEEVEMFCDGTDVDYSILEQYGLIEKKYDGWVLTKFGCSFLRKNNVKVI